MATSVFECMTPAQSYAVQHGAPNDVTAALQDAINRFPSLYFPAGTYRISAPLRLQTWTCLIGDHSRLSILQGTHAGVLLLYPLDNVQCSLERLRLAGPDCTAVAVDKAPGPLAGYLNQWRMRDCNVDHNLAFGIDAAMLCCHVADTTFGYLHGASEPVTPLRAIRSHNVGTNAPNLNTFERLVFNFCGSPGSTAAVDLHGGVSAAFRQCDWEGGGRALKTQSMAHVSLADCWFERNIADWLIYAGESYTPMELSRVQFQSNAAPHLIECDDAHSAGLMVRNCYFGLPEGAGWPLWFNAAASHEMLPGALVWENNHVTGGDPANDLTTRVRRMGVHLPQGWARISTTAPNIDSVSEANAYATRHDIGDVTITLATPFCSNVFTSCIVGNAADADDVLVRAWATSTDSIRLHATRDGEPIDCVVSLQWSGK